MTIKKLTNTALMPLILMLILEKNIFNYEYYNNNQKEQYHHREIKSVMPKINDDIDLYYYM